MKKAYLALGTNIEPRLEHLTKAIKLLENNPKIIIMKKSFIYETKPVGYTEQADFLNMVIHVDTLLSSMELLHICQAIEQELGRKREIRFGPRTIDLDILTYNQKIRNEEKLTLPHPRMHERAFVLVPLHEIAPNYRVPVFEKRAEELIKDLPSEDLAGISKWVDQLGRRIRAFRKLKGYTQIDLTEKIDVPISILGGLERGTYDITLELLNKISDELSVSKEEILLIDEF